MQQPCSKCGYVSDRPARFCRNCGAPLFVENEATSASTRNYGQVPNTDPNRPWTGHAPSEPRSADTPNTARFYRPPAVHDYGVPEKKKSNAKTWLIVILSILLVAGGAVGLLTFTIVNRVRERVQIPSQEVLADIQAQIEDQIREAKDRAREAERMAREAQRDLPVVEGVPQPPDAPPAPAAPAAFDKFKYPKADILRSSSLFGTELLQMSTSDNVATVSEFYKKLVGEAAIRNNSSEGESVVYQVPGSPSTIIAISPDEDNPGKTEIAVIRSQFNLPKLNIKVN
ncbi:MAG: hypothetical protein IPM66_07535 [Acidobacteriota bacterium]|nr:MAG: hypothetical protein IPM66_07535 [Acidobacteriota bacterium]